MDEIGRFLVYTGLILVFFGLIIILLSKTGIPLGKLPGDIYVERDNFVFFFPVATSILISLILTLVLFLSFLLTRK